MLALVVALLALAAPAAAQLTYDFEPILFEPPAPDGRIDAPLVYDPTDRRLYMFGGQAGGFLNDLWAYSFDQAAWTELQPGGGPPAGRRGHTMVFDGVRRRLVVFGGQASGFFNDVWAYDIASNTWTQLDGGGPKPNTRYGHSGITDTMRDRMVISHGFAQGRFDDTWAFDFATNTWTDVSPAARPLRRCLHHAVHDPKRDQMLFFGGCASGFGPCPLNDFWSFNLESHTWTELPREPPARQFYGTGFDIEMDRMVVFGGDGNGGRLDDVWEFDPEGAAWESPAISDPRPSARSRHQGEFIPGMGVVFFGGNTPQGRTNELWLFALARSPEVTQAGVGNAFNFESGSVAPAEIVSLFVRNGGPRRGVSSQFGPDGVLPFELAGVTITWNGMPSPAYFVSEGQINVQIPYEKATDPEVELIIIYRGQASVPVRLPVVPAKAGLFPVVFNQDGTINSEQNPASPGSVIIVFVTGQGVTAPPSPTGAYPMNGVFPEPVADVAVEIGGAASEILFKGQAPFTAGVMQLNARLGSATGSLVILVRIGQAISQDGVVVWVGAP